MKRLHFLLAVLSALLLPGCGKQGGNTPVPSPSTPVDVTTNYSFKLSGALNGSCGVFFYDADGMLFNSNPIRVELGEDGIYSCRVTHQSDKSMASAVCVSPYQQLFAGEDVCAKARLFACQTVGGSRTAVSQGRVALSADCTNEVNLEPLTKTVTLSPSALDEYEDIRLMVLDLESPCAGILCLSVDGAAEIHPKYQSSKLALCFDGGTSQKEYPCRVFSSVSGVAAQPSLVVTDRAIVEKGTAVDAMTFNFLDETGQAATVINKGAFALSASNDGKVYSFTCDNASISAGEGLVLKCDYVTPGFVSVPTIENKQITRVICCMDCSSDPAPHTIWLETFDGTSWNKMPGMELLASLDPASVNAGILDFVIPKKSVSASGVYRIGCGAGSEITCIRSITLAYEDESCSHDPRSLVGDDYKNGWVLCGTSASPDNNYDPKECIVIDSDVSHVDDGSGSLRLGGLACINNFKPWIGWRYKDFPVEAGATYRIYFCIKTENMPSTASLFLSIGFKNSSKAWLTGWVPGNPSANNMNGTTSLWIDKVKGSHDWMKLSADIIAPSDAVTLSYFQFMLQSVINAPDAFVWFDDINVVKVN